ncbi:Creatinase/aminopeptidase [Trametopsis cervina]|nr:Creatinase/aminopeptidase [Trametopsis cervina]
MGGGSSVQTVNTSARLNALRELMKKRENNVTAYVVPSEDQHYSEYSAHCDERRAFISGFTGSAGTAIITLDSAFLFTDGRYFLQAEKQLDSNWTLMKQGLPDVPTWQEFLHKKLDERSLIGMDPALISATDAESLQTSLKAKDSQLVSLTENLVDQVWEDRPSRPTNEVFPLEIKFSGEPHTEKIKKVQDELVKRKHKAVVVNMLDEVAWLFNLRGSDIDYNPVFFAYAAVTQTSAILFINPAQVTDTVRAHLGSAVEIRPYSDFFTYLSGTGAELELSKDAQILLGDKASLAIAEAIGRDNIVIARSLIADLKSIKNPTEVEGFRQSHIRDGAALARYFCWLEEQLNTGAELTESQVADQLEKYRSELDLFRGLSFSTISATGPNGAIIHYEPDRVESAIVKKDQVYLCDSGGQYYDGTTDVTRTWHFGTPTTEEKRAFTRVLQGHIAIDSAIFPNGTTGYVIDSWARRPLWEDGFDFRHGTGHGVGHFLNVHEGPHGIGVRIAYNSTPLKVGMTVSNEPGYYADGRFGIRIESVVVVREAKTPNNFGDKGFLGFETLTMCPIHKNLIEVSLLSAAERKWIDNYHAEVLEKVSPLLKNDLKTLAWLERECSPL